MALSWLSVALAPEWNRYDLDRHLEAGECVLISKRDGLAIGIATVRAGAPVADAACLAFVAIDPAERFRGLGGEAALALERRARESWGIERVLAPVPEGRGLALYFWLRLGLRPLTGVEAPWPVVGIGGRAVPGIWMARMTVRHKQDRDADERTR